MSVTPLFTQEVEFAPERAAEILRAVPAGAGVVALFGHAATDRPHLLQSANLRRRLQRLLMPPPAAEGQTKRLNLRDRVARIAWHATSSDLESLLLLHRSMTVVFGVEEARRKLRFSPPFTVRYAVENRFPRIYVTNHLRRRSLHTTFGPFASRLDADRYREAVEDLFLIRRCFMELHPSPGDPGCIYGEMHKCMAPCQARCNDEQYGAEAQRTLDFLRTRGASLVAEFEAEREQASADMQFEEAAAAHARVMKAKSVAAIADALVQPLDGLRAVLLLPFPAAPHDDTPRVQVFVFAEGCLRGPEVVSLLGVRLAKEQAQVGSSLFAQPMMLAAVPLQVEPKEETTASPKPDRRHPPSAGPDDGSADERLLAAISRLEDQSGAEGVDMFGDHLAMLRRWYYRPEKQREGLLFQCEKEAWPVRKMVKAASKLVTDRVTESSAVTPSSSVTGNSDVISSSPTG